MSSIEPQRAQPALEKTCRCPSISSIIIWIVLLLVIGAVLWVSLTERGQQTLGQIEEKGPIVWLFGEGNQQAEDDAAAALERSGVIVTKEMGKGVTSVNFGNCPKPSDEDMQQISKLFHLVTANLANAEIADDQLAYLSNLKNMTSLVLNGTPVTDAGLVHLVGLPALQVLHISHCKVTDTGLEQIEKMEPLTILDLSNTEITDKGMKSIAKLKKINWLLLKGDKITDAGLAELNELPELKHLTLSTETGVTSEGIERIKKANPKLVVD